MIIKSILYSMTAWWYWLNFFLFSGFLIKPSNGQKGCEVGYVTHTNPRGKIPTWLTNKITSYVAPRMLRKLHKACIQYPHWKSQHRPNFKYWLNPEQITSPKINMLDVIILTFTKIYQPLEN